MQKYSTKNQKSFFVKQLNKNQWETVVVQQNWKDR